MTNRQAIDKDIKDWHARYPEHVSRLAKEASESPRMEGHSPSNERIQELVELGKALTEKTIGYFDATNLD